MLNGIFKIMKFETFFNIVETYKKGSEMLSELHDIGFDLFEGKYQLSNIMYEQLQHSIRGVYGDEGLDWVEWYIFECGYGVRDMGAFDEDGNKICQTLEEIFVYLEKQHKQC